MYRVNINLVDGQISLVSEGATQVARNEAVAARDVTLAARATISQLTEAAIGSAAAAAGSETSAATSAAIASTKAAEASDSAGTAGAAKEAVVSVAAGAGLAAFDTFADATAGLAGIAEGAVVTVFEDEQRQSRRTLYRKESGSLVFKVYADTYAPGGAVRALASKTRGTWVHTGDSNTLGRPGFENAIDIELYDSRYGALSEWTHYNMGVNGSTLAGWVANIANGNQSQAPVDYNIGDPLGPSNPWQVVNAEPDIIDISLLINDFLTPARRTNIGTAEIARANLRTLIEFYLDKTSAGILLRMPAPYAGEDFIVGAVNQTGWASDSPDGTIDTNAALNSAIIRQLYLEWQNAHPRVLVWDSAELFGVRCDDKTVDAQDPELGSGNPLIEDSPHPTALGYRRQVQYIARFLGLDQGRHLNTDIRKTIASIQENLFWSGVFYVANIANAGANTICDILPTPEHIHTQSASDTLYRLAGSPVPASRLRDAERAYLMADLAKIRQLLALRGAVKVYFPDSGNTYTATSLQLSQIVTNPGGDKYFQVQFNGVNFGSETTAIMQVYVESAAGLPFIQKDLQFSVGTTRGSGGSPYFATWTPTTFRASRPDGTGAVTLSLYIQNQNDGRWVGEGLTTANAPGILLGTFQFNSGIYNGTWTADPSLGTNWPNGLTVKNGHRIVAVATSGTFANGANVLLRE